MAYGIGDMHTNSAIAVTTVQGTSDSMFGSIGRFFGNVVRTLGKVDKNDRKRKMTVSYNKTTYRQLYYICCICLTQAIGKLGGEEHKRHGKIGNGTII